MTNTSWIEDRSIYGFFWTSNRPIDTAIKCQSVRHLDLQGIVTEKYDTSIMYNDLFHRIPWKAFVDFNCQSRSLQFCCNWYIDVKNILMRKELTRSMTTATSRQLHKEFLQIRGATQNEALSNKLTSKGQQ